MIIKGSGRKPEPFKLHKMVDWIAIQFPKMFKIFQELDIL